MGTSVVQISKVNSSTFPFATQRRWKVAVGSRPSLPVLRALQTVTLLTATITRTLHQLKIIKIHMLPTLPPIQMEAPGMPQPMAPPAATSSNKQRPNKKPRPNKNRPNKQNRLNEYGEYDAYATYDDSYDYNNGTDYSYNYRK